MKHMKGIFITGTDTGVGKTYVARLIAKELKRRGIDAGVMKPAETGCSARSGRLVPSDAVKLIKAAGTDDDLDLVNPYRFSKPLAPSMAAEMEKKKISPARIISSYRKLSRRHDFMIVEGAGGIMVPLNDSYCYLDLAADLELPVLIIARPGLGTINHTLLTITALKARKLKIAGIVINYAKAGKPGIAEQKSPGVIERLSDIKIIGTVLHGSRREADIADNLPCCCQNAGTRKRHKKNK